MVAGFLVLTGVTLARATDAPSAIVDSEFVFEMAPFRSRTRRRSWRRGTGSCVRGLRHGGGAAGRRHLAVAAHEPGWTVRLRSRPAVNRMARGTRAGTPCSSSRRAAPSSSSQIGPSPSGPRPHLDRRGALVVGLGPLAGRDPRPHPRQARRKLTRRRARRVEHRDVPAVHMERWTPADPASAAAWRKSGRLNDPRELEAIQPTLLVHSPTRLQALCRSRQKVVTEAWSETAGQPGGG